MFHVENVAIQKYTTVVTVGKFFGSFEEGN
jgi:hypothetical protein